MASIVLQATLLVLVAVLHQGNALRCWDCVSTNSPECDDPNAQSEHHRRFHTQDCDATLSQHPYSYEKLICRKIVERVSGKRVVRRSCSMPYPEERDVNNGVCAPQVSGSQTTIESCHICSTDLCNGAYSSLSQISATTSLFLFGIPSILFAYRWSF